MRFSTYFRCMPFLTWLRQSLDPAPLRPDLDRLQARVEALESALPAEIEILVKQVRDLEVEWTDWYDKYRRMYMRIAKRQSRSDAEDGAGDTNGGAGGVDPIQNPLARHILGG